MGPSDITTIMSIVSLMHSLRKFSPLQCIYAPDTRVACQPYDAPYSAYTHQILELLVSPTMLIILSFSESSSLTWIAPLVSYFTLSAAMTDECTNRLNRRHDH